MSFNPETGDKTAVATVTNNQDPERRGRIKVTCVALLGDESRSLPLWIETAQPWGWFNIPDVGQQVTVSYSLGSESDDTRGQQATLDIRWNGGSLFTDSDAEDPTPIGSEFTAKNYGKRRGYKTPRGHVMLFDDTARDEQIRMSWAGGTPSAPKDAFWSFDKDGSFIAQDAGGSLLFLNASGEASVTHSSGSYVLLSDEGITFTDRHSNSIVMGADGISILSQGAVTIMGSDTVINNALHFADAAGITTNVGAAVAIMNSSTVAGAALKATVVGAVPADGTALLAGVDVVAKL